MVIGPANRFEKPWQPFENYSKSLYVYILSEFFGWIACFMNCFYALEFIV